MIVVKKQIYVYLLLALSVKAGTFKFDEMSVLNASF